MQKRSLVVATASAVGVAIAGVLVAYFLVMPANLPENDQYCETHILVQTIPNADRKQLSRDILEVMGRLDSRFMYWGRDISLDVLGDDQLRISIDGVWSPDGSGARLIQAMEGLDSVGSVLDDRGRNLVTICQ